jgi:uracil-DNA glycosylase
MNEHDLKDLLAIKHAIIEDKMNQDYTKQGLYPLFLADPSSKIMIVGQAPGIKAQSSGLTWNDASGDRLREWLGVNRDTFYNPRFFAMVPMDFYYPGKGKSGDLPPRKGFAETWHPLILNHLQNVKLIILVGSYAQRYYLNDRQKKTLTETVRSYQDYLPQFFPLVHPSPRNIGWHIENPWFMAHVVPTLKELVHQILSSSDS